MDKPEGWGDERHTPAPPEDIETTTDAQPAVAAAAGSKRTKVALGWQNTRPSAAAKPKKKRPSNLFLELLQESQHETPTDDAPTSPGRSSAANRKSRRPRSLDEYLHTEERAKKEKALKKHKTEDAAKGPKKKRQSLIFERVYRDDKRTGGDADEDHGSVAAAAAVEEEGPSSSPTDRRFAKRKGDQLMAIYESGAVQKKTQKTAHERALHLNQEEGGKGEEATEAEDDSAGRIDREHERREIGKGREMARITATEQRAGDHHHDEDKDEGVLLFHSRSSLATSPLSSPQPHHHQAEGPPSPVTPPHSAGDMSPPPAPAPAPTSSSPSRQEFRHHVKMVKKQMRDANQVDVGTPLTHAPAAAGGGGGIHGHRGDIIERATDQSESPWDGQVVAVMEPAGPLMATPTKGAPPPPAFSSSSPPPKTSPTRPLPSRILRSGDISVFVKKKNSDTKGGSVPQGFVDVTHDRAAFDAFAKELEGSELVCWGTTYRYDTTNFRRSEILDRKVSEAAPIQYRQVLGVGFLPAKAKRPYFLALDARDFAQHPDVSALEGTDNDQAAANKGGAIALAERREVLKRFIEAESIRKVCYDTQESLKPILALYPRHAVMPRALVDPKLAAYVFDPEMKSYEFSFLAATFSVDQSLTRSPSGSPKDTTNTKRFFADMLTCFRLMTNLEGRLEKEGLARVFHVQEMPLTSIVAKMELRGVCFDAASLTEYQEAIQRRIHSLEELARRLVGHFVSLSSPKEVAHVLFEELKLPAPRRSRKQLTDQHSTSEKVLLKLKEHHPLPALILEYRHCQKLITTYIQSFSKKAIDVPEEGTYRIFASWQHTGTATGRISVTEPNMQALPRSAIVLEPLGDDVLLAAASRARTASATLLRRTLAGSLEDASDQLVPDLSAQQRIVINVRDAFVAPPGYVLLKADYSQMEMRILAHVSGDEYLKQFFLEGRDIHKLIAARWLGKDPDEVDEVERDRAKRVVYGILYGMGARSLSEILNVEHAEAEEWIGSFLAKFPNTAQFLKDTAQAAHEQGFIRTLLNRRRLFPTINFEAYAHKAERQAVNSVIQGTAADLVKLAMLAIDREIVTEEQRELTTIGTPAPESSTDKKEKGKEKEVVEEEEEEEEGHMTSLSRPIAALVLQIHDELVYEVREDRVKWMEEVMVRCMEGGLPIRLDVPIPVRLYLGTRFGHLRPLPEKGTCGLRGPPKKDEQEKETTDAST